MAINLIIFGALSLNILVEAEKLWQIMMHVKGKGEFFCSLIKLKINEKICFPCTFILFLLRQKLFFISMLKSFFKSRAIICNNNNYYANYQWHIY